MIIRGIIHLALTLAFLILSSYSQNITQPPRNLESSVPYEFPFEKTIWTYWVSDTQTPVIVQLCIDNMAATAKKHNFTFILLNESNVRNYVQNYDELFVEVRKKAVQKSFVSGADLLRVLVIEQNGGIWFDTTTLFPNGLTDIQNIISPEFQHLIVNKFSKKPDAMICYFGNAQNRIQKKISDPSDPTRTILFNQYPNYEAWSMFAKKNSSIMTQIRKTFSKFTVTQWPQLQRHFISQDIFISILDEYGIYFYINMAITYTLQKKQLQFDRELTFFGQRKFAFQHFNLWGLNAEYGPLMQTRTDLVPYDYLFWYSKEEIKAMGFNLMFFLKQNSHLRQFSQDKFSLLIKYFNNKNTTFDQFLATNLNQDTCQNMTFILQGSIIAQLLINSTVSQNHFIPTITKQQHKRWIDRCKANYTLLDKFKQEWQRFDNIITTYMYSSVYIHKGRVNSLIHENENLTLKDWIKIKFDDNVFLLWELFLQTLVAVFLILPFMVLNCCHLNLLSFGNMFFRHQKGLNQANTGSDELNQLNDLTNSDIQTGISSKTKQKPTNITLMIFFLLVLNLLMYSDVAMIGGRQQLQTIFISVLITFVLQAYIEDQITKLENTQKDDFQIRWGYALYSMIINYLVSVLCLTHIWRNLFWVHLLAQMFGIVGPCVMKLKHILKPQVIDYSSEVINSFLYEQSFIYRITYFITHNKCRSAVLLLMFLSIAFPNLRYMAGQSGYYIKYVSIIGVVYLLKNFVQVLVICLKRHAWKQLTRLGFLLIMVMRLCYTYYEYHYLVQRYRRVSFVCMTIALMTLLYIQIGTSVDKRFNHQAYWGKLSFNIVQWVFMILPLFVIQILGLEVFMHQLMGKFITGFYLHYIFFILSAVLTFLLYSFGIFSQQPIYHPINSIQLSAKITKKQTIDNLQFQESNS